MSTQRASDASSDSLETTLKHHGVFLHDDDDKVVDWHDHHKDHPRSWGVAKKTYTTIMICWLEFGMTLISTSGTTASEQAQEEYGYSSTLGYFAFVSVYLLAQAFGGILVSPFSEAFGRRTLYIYACVIFIIFNVIIAASRSFVAVFFGRFFTGFVASIPATVAFGNFDDMYDAQQRIWIVYLYTLAGNAGISVGPIYASYISRAIGWRWIFYIATIASAVSLFFAFGMDESRATSLLARKVKHIKTSTGQEDLRPASAAQKFSLKRFLTTSVFRPLLFLFTEPIVTACAILCSIAFALFYAETESLTLVYTSPRLPPSPFNETNASLSFIAVLLGLLLDALPRFYDVYLYKQHQKASNSARLTPETKITSFAIACPAMALGLWIFAWTIPPYVTNVHWIVSMIGLVLVGFAANDFAVVLFGYITDSYGPYAASAVSTLSLTRTIAAAAFPLFITQMYTGMGANLATTVFAAIATAFAGTPYVFLKYGARLRRKSKWAVTTEEEKNAEMEMEESHPGVEEDEATMNTHPSRNTEISQGCNSNV